MTTGKQRKTFISYSRVDKEFALELARELRSSGFDIWLDQLDIPTGSRWDDEVERALDECEIFMVILTPASSTSDNVKDEIGYAIDTNKRILPILLENARVPLRLRRFQYVDFTSKSYEEGVEGAKRLLRKLIDEPTIPRSEMPAASQVRKAIADRQAQEKAGQPSQTQADEPGSKPFAAEREKLLKAATLMTRGKQLLRNGNLEEAAQTFRQILTLLPNHEKTLALLAEAEAGLSQEPESSNRRAREEADQLEKQKTEEERLAKAEVDRKAKEEADRFAAQRAEKERIEREKANRERLALAEEARKAREEAEANRKAKEEADRLAALKAEEERLPKAESEQKRKQGVRGLVIGGIVIAVLCVAGIGIGIIIFSNGSTTATEAPSITEVQVTEAPVTEAPATEAPATEPPATEPPATEAPATEPPSSSSACSREGSQPVQVLFENQTNLNLDYYWIGYDCQPQYYGTLAAGESKTIGTYVSHVWQFVDDQTGGVYLEYTVDVNGYLEITSDASAVTIPSLSFSEDFSNNSRDWTVETHDSDYWTGTRIIDNGSYLWDVKQIKIGSFVSRIGYPNSSPVENIDISVDALLITGTPANFCYGFYFRYSEGAYYMLRICNTQYYKASYYDGSKWETLLDWTKDTVIQSNDWNNIRVVTRNEEFSFYINQELVAAVSDSHLTKGYAGLLIDVEDKVPGQVMFDNFQVTEK